MKKQSQLAWTRHMLLTKGYVTRNQALRKLITRLSARIKDLREDGFEIEGNWKKTKAGKDYVYTLLAAGERG